MTTQVIKIWFDGGSLGNPGKGYGSFEIDGGDWIKHKVSRQQIGDSLTCNQAEYLSLIAALKWLRGELLDGQYVLEIVSDSSLVVNQVLGNWKTKNPKLVPLKDETLELLRPFKEWYIEWKGRESNVARFGH